LKENVIIGKLIPAGTGFQRGPFAPDSELGDNGEEQETADSEMEPALEEINEDTVIQDLEELAVEED
jgi:hypothetical protein